MSKIVMTGELHPHPGDSGTKFTVTERWIGNSDVYDIELRSVRSDTHVLSAEGLTEEQVGSWLLGKVDW